MQLWGLCKGRSKNHINNFLAVWKRATAQAKGGHSVDSVMTEVCFSFIHTEKHLFTEQ